MGDFVCRLILAIMLLKSNYFVPIGVLLGLWTFIEMCKIKLYFIFTGFRYHVAVLTCGIACNKEEDGLVLCNV